MADVREQNSAWVRRASGTCAVGSKFCHRLREPHLNPGVRVLGLDLVEVLKGRRPRHVADGLSGRHPERTEHDSERRRDLLAVADRRANRTGAASWPASNGGISVE